MACRGVKAEGGVGPGNSNSGSCMSLLLEYDVDQELRILTAAVRNWPQFGLLREIWREVLRRLRHWGSASLKGCPYGMRAHGFSGWQVSSGICCFAIGMQ